MGKGSLIDFTRFRVRGCNHISIFMIQMLLAVLFVAKTSLLASTRCPPNPNPLNDIQGFCKHGSGHGSRTGDCAGRFVFSPLQFLRFSSQAFSPPLMDFRRVDTAFRPYAGLLQLTLVAAILAYAIYQLLQVFTEAPPVEVLMEPWTHVGKWALCAHESQRDLYAAGMALVKG